MEHQWPAPGAGCRDDAGLVPFGLNRGEVAHGQRRQARIGQCAIDEVEDLLLGRAAARADSDDQARRPIDDRPTGDHRVCDHAIGDDDGWPAVGLTVASGPRRCAELANRRR